MFVIFKLFKHFKPDPGVKGFPLFPLQTISNEAAALAVQVGTAKGARELPSDTTLGLIQDSCSQGQSGKQIKHIILGQQSCGNTKSTQGSHLQHPHPPQTLLEPPHSRRIRFTPVPASQYPHQNNLQ